MVKIVELEDNFTNIEIDGITLEKEVEILSFGRKKLLREIP